jgi:hypothetical protein
MTDVRLDSTYDLYWVDGLLDTVEGDEEILQRVWIALNTGLGEWAFDILFGFPYLQVTGVRAVTDMFIEAAVRLLIEPITGTGSIRAITIVREPEIKKATITVDTIFGVVEAVV